MEPPPFPSPPPPRSSVPANPFQFIVGSVEALPRAPSSAGARKGLEGQGHRQQQSAVLRHVGAALSALGVRRRAGAWYVLAPGRDSLHRRVPVASTCPQPNVRVAPPPGGSGQRVGRDYHRGAKENRGARNASYANCTETDTGGEATSDGAGGESEGEGRGMGRTAGVGRATTQGCRAAREDLLRQGGQQGQREEGLPFDRVVMVVVAMVVVQGGEKCCVCEVCVTLKRLDDCCCMFFILFLTAVV